MRRTGPGGDGALLGTLLQRAGKEASRMPKKPIDRHHCRLMGPVAIVVQLLMGLLVLGTLAYKRNTERPRRRWRVWMLDVSKQVIGQLIVHMLNVLCSYVGALVAKGNPCAQYFLNVLLDTTLGVGIIYVLVHGLTYLLAQRMNLPGFATTDYQLGMRQSLYQWAPWSCWLRQLGVYLVAIIVMKLSVVALINAAPFLLTFGAWLLGLFGTHRSLQVIFAMAIFPLIMNTVQFWLVDTVLRDSMKRQQYTAPGPTSNYSPDTALDEEPLTEPRGST